MNVTKFSLLVATFIVLAAAVTLFHVSSFGPREKTSLNPAARLTKANNYFGFRLLECLTNTQPKENVFLSPLSIQLALQMTYMGAEGETKEEMEKVFGLSGLETDVVAKNTRQLLAELDDLSGKIELSIANSIWARQGLPFKTDFLKMGKKYYGAKIEELDFDSPKAVKRINRWVSEKTHKKIKRIGYYPYFLS